MLILAGVSLSMVIGENSVLDRAQTATAAHKYSGYNEQIQLVLNKDMTCAGEGLKKYIPQMDDDDLENFIIIDGKLTYIGKDQKQKEIAESVGIDVSENATVADIIAITEKIFPAAAGVEYPANDTIPASTAFTGKRLYNKTSQNMETWNLVIDYDKNNKEKARYGSGFYLLDQGEHVINGETITIEGKYVLDYRKKNVTGLSERAVEWSVDTSLAVKNGLILNIDPTNLADGNWTGIIKHGDVRYDVANKALVFNESPSNTTGSGGYLELSRSGVNFSNGFTFEVYCKLSRLDYINATLSNNRGMGLFCRLPNLNASYTQALRFGRTKANTICKFNSSSSKSGGTGSIYSQTGGAVADRGSAYKLNEDFYLTFVYERPEGDRDLIKLYINGELYGSAPYGKDSYTNGLNTWNNDSCPFFVGVSPWHADGNLYFLKGSVYSCRLYTTPMNADQVKENMNMTQRYRESF